MPRYEFTEGSSNKFWEIELDGKKFTTTYGRIGGKAQSTTKSFSSPAEAKQEYQKLIAEKTKKGYELVGGAPVPAVPLVGAARNTELEARLVENPDDVDAHLVYADFLQTKGDPRGELITLQHGGKKKLANDLLAKHADHFLGPLKHYTKALDGVDKPVFEWHLGFITSARLSYESNSLDDLREDTDEDIDTDDLSLDDALTHLLTHPSGFLLQDLLIPLNMLDDGCYFEPLIKVVAKHGAPALRRLRLGEYVFAGPRRPEGTDYNYEISWTSFGDMRALWKAVPRLEHVELLGCMGKYGHPPTRFGDIELPRLRHLDIKTGGMDRENTRAIAAADWPALEYMDLWFGRSNYGFSGDVDDILPILEGKRLSKLKHLGLMNAEFTDQLCEHLPKSKILPQLEELSLALGTLSDRGAETLAANAAAFSHLRVLDLESNFLTSKGTRLVKGLCKKVRVADQKEPYDWQEENEGRYASVGE